MKRLVGFAFLTAAGVSSTVLAAPTTAATLEEALRSSTPGQIVEVPNLDFEKLQVLPVKISPATGPQYLLSDRPEYFRSGDGISMQEQVKPGLVRLYLYHVPDPAGDRKTISAVIENLGSTEMHVRFKRYAFPRPGGDYFKIGKQGLRDYFNCGPEKAAAHNLIVPPHSIVPLDAALDGSVVTKDILVHAIFEFEIDQPARVSVFQRGPDVKSADAVKVLAKLPLVLKNVSSGAGRGLFNLCDFAVTLPEEQSFSTKDGAAQIVVADGKRDPWIRGHDSIENVQTSDKGNYGVMYDIHLKRIGKGDGQALAVLVTHHRTDMKGCRYSASAASVGKGIFPGGTVVCPADEATYEGWPKAVVLQRYPPLPAGEEQTIDIVYSPPGASCLPTPIVLIPYGP